jgi:hypothetical protein
VSAPPLHSSCWITHADARFLPLARVLAEGLAAFSRRPLVLYAVDCEPGETGFGAPGLVVRRMAGGGRHIAYLKLAALLDALDSGVEQGVYLDADHVPTPEVDRLFTMATAESTGDLPLLPRHPRDLGDEVNGALMAELGVAQKSMPYAHSCAMGFGPACRAFLAECDGVARGCERRGAHPPVVDETIVNVLLWKRGATRQLPSANLSHRLFESWLLGRLAGDPEWISRYAGHPWLAATFHYCKDPARARWMLGEMVRRTAAKIPPRPL